MTHRTATKDQLLDLADRSGVRDGGTIYEMLAEKYSEANGRHYHTLEHVGWVLHGVQTIATNRELSDSRKLDIEWAAWFHDAEMSFSSAGNDDEERSAKLAYDTLNAAGYREAFWVRRLIRATAHTQEPDGDDQALLVDADLGILAASETAFAEYERKVRREWAHVPDEAFRTGRLAVLQRFAGMRRIYSTDWAYNQWERKARFNMAQSMQRLSAGIVPGAT